MAYKLRITEKADKDLDAILCYILTELKNRDAAMRFADEVERHYRLLLENPRLYGECQQPMLRRSHYRKVVIGDYLMIYRVDETNGIVYIERYFSELQDYAAKI